MGFALLPDRDFLRFFPCELRLFPRWRSPPASAGPGVLAASTVPEGGLVGSGGTRLTVGLPRAACNGDFSEGFWGLSRFAGMGI